MPPAHHQIPNLLRLPNLRVGVNGATPVYYDCNDFMHPLILHHIIPVISNTISQRLPSSHFISFRIFSVNQTCTLTLT